MYLSVLRYQMRTDVDIKAHTADILHMQALAKSQPGFISYKTYQADDGEMVAMTQWTSEAAVDSWSINADHERLIERGRTAYYERYTLFTCIEARVFDFDRKHP